MTTKKENIHLIGIGGSGMIALANLLLEKGYLVSGSDKNDFAARKSLERKGIKIYLGHRASNLKSPKTIICSSAIPKDNIELLQAQKEKIPLFNRFNYLINLLADKKIISIAGTHGKSTTTAMVAHLLEKSGWEPTVYIGAKNTNYPFGSSWGKGEYAVIETDEHDKSFLRTPSFLCLITNVDNDHLSIKGPYQGKFSLLKKAFQNFSKKSRSGFIVLNNDDDSLRNLGKKSKKDIISFGIDNKADLIAKNIRYQGKNTFAELFFKNKFIGKLILSVPEKENIYNALGAISISQIIGIPFKNSLKHLKSFSGIKRRFSVLYNKNIAIVDDYAHHPTEIKSVLRMTRRVFPKRRIVLILEPHRYSRISILYKDYAPAVKNCDALFLLPIDPSNEKPIKGVESRKIFQEILKKLILFLKKGDVILFAGPGRISNLPPRFINLAKRKKI